ncbi:MAG: diguanylate cyclase [Candidatus Auribacterota bacterium]|nr:diguanylate cyclase [Candidatus Auribacterota bacterium]
MISQERKQLILAVDDAPNILKAIEYILNKAGYPVLTARNGEEALTMIKQERPALVISDIMMPGLDGYDLCNRLRLEPATSLIPFIFLSAKDTVDDRIKGIQTGADAYLTKPFNRDELLALVETVLRRHRIYIEQTMKDELTGLPNRAYLFKALDNELARARRYRRSLSVVMIDLDHFKSVNDTYGHLFGDKILIRLSGTLREEIRRQDILGRYGGEEFLIILPETTGEAAAVLMERCRRKVAETPYIEDSQSSSVSVTFSAGIAELTGDDHSIEDLIERADRALYKAKENGRDQVVVG